MEPQPQRATFISGGGGGGGGGMEGGFPQPQRAVFSSVGGPPSPSFIEPQPQQIQISSVGGGGMGGGGMGLPIPQTAYTTQSPNVAQQMGAPTAMRAMPEQVDYTPQVGVNPNVQVGAPLQNEQSIVNSPIAPQTKQKNAVSVEEAIEVIADAVLQIVLFQVEADENQTYLTQPNYEPLVAGVRYLGNLADAKANMSEEAKQSAYGEKMRGFSKTIKRTTIEISEALAVLQEEMFNQEAKEKLLFACREVMLCLVPLLEVSDRYDCEKIIKQAKNARESVHSVSQCVAQSNYAEFNEFVRLCIYANVTLAKMILGREKIINDPELEQRLQDANAVIRQIPEPLITKIAEEASNPALRNERENMQRRLFQAIDEVILVVLLSNERMFKGLLLDLGPLERDTEVIEELGDLMDLMSSIGPALEALKEAGKVNSAAAMLPLLKRQKDIFEALKNRLKSAEGIDKNVVGQAITTCQDHLKNAVGIIKAVLAQNGEFYDDFAPEIDAAASAWAHCERNAILKGMDGMGGAMLDVEMAAQEMMGQIENQVAIDPMALMNAGRGQLLEAKKLIAEGGPKSDLLVQATKAMGGQLSKVLKDSKNYSPETCPPSSETSQGLLKDLDELVALSRKLGVLGSAGEPTSEDIFEEEGFPMYAQVVMAAEGLADGIEARDQTGSVEAMKSLQDGLNNQALLARKNVNTCGLKNISDDLLALSKQLAPTLKSLLDSAKGWDAMGTRDKSEGMKDYSEKMYKATVTPLNQIVDAAAEIYSSIDSSPSEARAANLKEKSVKLCQMGKHLAVKDPKKFGPLLGNAKGLATTLSSTNFQDQNLPNLEKSVDDFVASSVGELSSASLEQNIASASVETETQLNRALQNSLANAPKEKVQENMMKANIALGRQIALVRCAIPRNQKMEPVARKLMALQKQMKANKVPSSQEIASFLQQLEDINMEQVEAWGDLEDQIEQVNMDMKDYNQKIQALSTLPPLSDPESLPAVQMRGAAQRGLLLTRACQGKEKSELKRKALGTKLDAFKKGLGDYNTTATQAVKCPETSPKFQESSNELQKKMGEITSLTCGDGIERLRKNGEICVKLLKDVEGDLNSPNDVTRENREKACLRLKNHAALAKPFATQCKNPQMKKQMLDLCKQCEETASEIQKTDLSQPLPPAVAQAAQENTTKGQKLCNVITALANKSLTEPAPEPEEAEIKSFSQAAIKVSRAVAHLVCDDTPRGRLFFTAQQVAKEMEVLSMVSKDGKKRDVVDSARRLAALLKSFAADARLVANHIIDPKMKQEVLSQSKMASNFATQLKILCAVKFTTADDDSTAGNQLVSCGAGLALSVVKTVENVSISELTKRVDNM